MSLAADLVTLTMYDDALKGVDHELWVTLKHERPPPSGDGLLKSTLPLEAGSQCLGTRTVGHVPHEPLDPFAGDPEDPAAQLASSLEDGDDEPPLTPIERQEVVSDLADLEGFRALLEPRDVLGIVLECDDCGDHHYMDWDLMLGNLRNLLAVGRTRVHEPAFAPDAAKYVSWEYARGYSDGVLEAAEDGGDADPA